MSIKEILELIKDIDDPYFYDDDLVSLNKQEKQNDKEPHEILIHYFSNNKPNYLVIEEEEEKLKETNYEDNDTFSLTSNENKKNKKKKTLLKIGVLLATSYILFNATLGKEKTEKIDDRRTFISENSDDSAIINTDVISGKELYDTFIQYARDNDIVLNGENYRDFATFYIKHLENGGEKYYSLGGRNNG